MAPKGDGKKAAAAPQGTRCDEGGPEILPAILRVHQGEQLEYHLWVCKANARIIVLLDGKTQIDEPSQDEAGFVLPMLPHGDHILVWSIQGAGQQWQTRTEVSVEGIVRFRVRKSNDGNNPINGGMLVIQVI